MLQIFGVVETKLCKIKLERMFVSLYVDPLYGEPLKIIFDKCVFVFQKTIVEIYNLCNKGPSPKRLKLSKDFQKEELHELFGPCLSKNGY
jgi:hypothetical protein